MKGGFSPQVTSSGAVALGVFSGAGGALDVWEQAEALNKMSSQGSCGLLQWKRNTPGF
jgi:hypothetical protein